MYTVPESGNNFIDANHIGLVKILEALENDWKLHGSSGNVVKIAHKFLSSLHSHFRHEEIILKGAGYKQLDSHAKKHRNIEYLLYSILSSGLFGATAFYFVDKSQSTIIEHELVEDQEYWNIFADHANTEHHLIEWSSDYETGIEGVDSHHKSLINHINRLNTRIANGQSEELVVSELKQLCAYSMHHFAEEEVFLEKMGNARLHYHRRSHDVLIKDLRTTIDEINDGEIDVSTVGDYLKFWFVNHLMVFDVPSFSELPRED